VCCSESDAVTGEPTCSETERLQGGRGASRMRVKSEREAGAGGIEMGKNMTKGHWMALPAPSLPWIWVCL
jgi:hypothetical protein